LSRYRCDWDDGYTGPPTPRVDGAGRCLNAAVGVHYQLYWAGGSVVRVNATLVLTNLSAVTTASL